MDQKLAAQIWADGKIVETNDQRYRIWPETIDGRWLYPGEMVIEHKGYRYVVDWPRVAAKKDL